MPATTRTSKRFKGRGRRYPMENTGDIPKTTSVTVAAVIEAVIPVRRRAGDMVFCISSKPKITPARGALKAAAKPAPAPAVIRIRLSNLVRRLVWLRP